MKSIKGSPAKQAIIVISLSALFLSACDNETVEEITQIPPKVEEDPNAIVLSEDGIGPIQANTTFNMHKMTLAFNQYSVVQELNFANQNSSPIIRISEGVNTIMSIIPDASHEKIYSVIVEDNIVKNGLGHPLGTTYSKIYNYGQNEQCQFGTEEDMSGKVICYAPQYPNILYVFNDNTPDILSAIPPADVLQGWALESIIWRPKK